jgi:hypothetical protein
MTGLWNTYMVNGRPTHIDRATTESINHIAHASVTAQGPHIGTQTKTNILIIVANPMGNVPRNKDWLE